MQATPKTKSAQAHAQSSASAPARIDLWMVLDLIAGRWLWLAAGTILCGAAFFMVAAKVVKPKFTASAQLLRYDTPGVSDFLKSDTPMSSDTFAGLLRAPELLRQTGEKASPPIPPEIFARQFKVDPSDDSDMVNVLLIDRSPQQAVD